MLRNKTGFLSITVVAALSALFAVAQPSRAAAAPPPLLAVLTANIGNIDFRNCGRDYTYKLCLLEWEDVIGRNIRAAAPDIVSLQEVYDVNLCAKKPPEKNPKRVCHQFEQREPREQARRILGDDYTIVCSPDYGFECIGVRRGVGKVSGCAEGAFCREGGVFHKMPDGCEPMANIIGIDLEINGSVFRIVNAHPQASGAACRAKEVERMFDGYENTPPAADPQLKTIAMGDMNLDPFGEDDESVAEWKEHVGDGKPFRYLSGPAESDPPRGTNGKRVIDHVITNFATGKCETLGEAEGTKRIDGVTTKQTVLEANDHRAILCRLNLFPQTNSQQREIAK